LKATSTDIAIRKYLIGQKNFSFFEDT